MEYQATREFKDSASKKEKTAKRIFFFGSDCGASSGRLGSQFGANECRGCLRGKCVDNVPEVLRWVASRSRWWSDSATTCKTTCSIRKSSASRGFNPVLVGALNSLVRVSSDWYEKETRRGAPPPENCNKKKTNRSDRYSGPPQAVESLSSPSHDH